MREVLTGMCPKIGTQLGGVCKLRKKAETPFLFWQSCLQPYWMLWMYLRFLLHYLKNIATITASCKVQAQLNDCFALYSEEMGPVTFTLRPS